MTEDKKVWGVVGSSQQWTGKKPKNVDAILMLTCQPDPGWVAGSDKNWHLDNMLGWEVQMGNARRDIMDDDTEFIWDAVGINKAPQSVQDRYTAKKAVRNSQPV